MPERRPRPTPSVTTTPEPTPVATTTTTTTAAPVPTTPKPAPEPKAEYVIGSWGNASIDQKDDLFIRAMDIVRAKRGTVVNPRFLKAMMDVESGQDGNYPPGKCRPCDGTDCVPACGPMQIKWPYHKDKCPECDKNTVAGQIEMAAHILGKTMKERGVDEYRAFLMVYFTQDDVNGTTQNEYTAHIRTRVRQMETDAAGATPVPKPTKPVDPLSVIVGGASYTADYGFGDDVGLHYYDYFDQNHGDTKPGNTQHPGVDVMVPLGTPLYSPAAGIVDCVGNAGTPRWGQACGAYGDTMTGGVGNITILLDGGVKLTLGHCKGASVRPGDRVAAGQRVGSSGGMNGPHCHVETSVLRNGSYYIIEPIAALRSVMGGAAPAPVYRSHDIPGMDRPILLPEDIRVTVMLTPLDSQARPNDRRPGANRSGRKLTGSFGIVSHETGNPNMGAKAHAEWQAAGTPNHPDGRIGVHAYIDASGIWITLPFDEQGVHSGDGRNQTSLGFERCVHQQGAERNASERNTQELQAAVLRAKGLTAAAALTPHHRGGGCPAQTNSRGTWPQWVQLVDQRIAANGVTEPGPAPQPVKLFPVNVPDDVVKTLFPLADPSPKGIVTPLWLDLCKRDGKWYPFVGRTVVGDATWWVFSGVVIRTEDGKATEVKPEQEG